MKMVIVNKASPIIGPVEDAEIKIEGTLPNFEELNQAADAYDIQAYYLAKVLIETLPGGTLIRLTSKLLQHEANQNFLKIPRKVQP